MHGAGVFYSTYWIRYTHGRITFDLAVENTGKLFVAAKRAGVGRIVHFSVTDVSPDSGLPHFSGKAQVEDMLMGLGVPYAIIRPTLVFGVGDLLLQQHGLGVAALSRLPLLQERRLPGPTRPRGRLSVSGGRSWLSEREFRGRRCRVGHVLLRGPASAAGLHYGRPRQVGAHSPVGGSRLDWAGRPAQVTYRTRWARHQS